MKINPPQQTETGSALPPETEPGAPALTPPGPTTSGEHRLSGAIMIGVPALLVVVTFLFWYQTWFGRRLTESEMREYLLDTSVPHKTQHALTQVVTEIVQHDPAVKRVYPEVVALAGNKEPGIRSMAAWVMGQDSNSPEFHQTLLKLVADPEPMVRWNAALGLARFGDAAGELEIKSMLHPFELRATQAGTISFEVNASDAVKSGSVVARIKSQSAAELETRSPLAGIVERRVVKDGAPVAAGDVIAVIAPAEQQIWEALVALYLVGKPDALADVELLARPANGNSERVRQQAALTIGAIRERSEEELKVEGRKLKVKQSGQ